MGPIETNILLERNYDAACILLHSMRRSSLVPERFDFLCWISITDEKVLTLNAMGNITKLADDCITFVGRADKMDHLRFQRGLRYLAAVNCFGLIVAIILHRKIRKCTIFSCNICIAGMCFTTIRHV